MTFCFGLRKGLALWLVVTLVASSSPVWALPADGHVEHGDAVLRYGDHTLTVAQLTDKLIINWDAFSIGPDGHVAFHQPGPDAVALNRVLGSDPSDILGQLTANGQVFIINPKGVLFGRGARVDVGSLIASTLALSDADFLAGNYTFTGGAAAGRVENLGRLVAAPGGAVALIGQQVENRGEVLAFLGSIVLGAGEEVTLLQFGGDGLLSLQVGEAVVDALVASSGLVAADGGLVSMSVAAKDAALQTVLNQDGIVRARSAELRDGRILLSGGASGEVHVAGELDASGLGLGASGGRVHVTGDSVRVAEGARIDVSGDAGGGAILLGGGLRGEDPSVPNAGSTRVEAGVQLLADALGQGDGGTVIVWADGAAHFFGEISARGGELGGDGGFAEVSGRQRLSFDGAVDMRAPHGSRGTLLLDPENITIIPGDAPAAGDPDQTIGAGQIEHLLATTNVTLEAGDTITVGAAITTPAGIDGIELALVAGQTIAINAPITSAAGHNSLWWVTFDAPTIAVSADVIAPEDNPQTELRFHNTSPGGHATTVTSAADARISAESVEIKGRDGQVDLAGPVEATYFSIQMDGTPTWIRATNPLNSAYNTFLPQRLILGGDGGVGSPLVVNGAVEFASGGALDLVGDVTAESIHIVAAGDLTLVDPTGGNSRFASEGLIVLAATEDGVFINNADLLGNVLQGSGRKIIYTSSDAGGFDDGGLRGAGFVMYNPVAYGEDPQSGEALVIYVAEASGLPLLVITADDIQKVYDRGFGPIPYSASFSEGVHDVVWVDFRLADGPAVNVGTYTVVPYGAVSQQYRIEFQPGTLQITPAPLTVTADNDFRTYGAPNPEFTATITGLVLGDTEESVTGLTLSTAATQASNVGTYAIVPAGATAQNYDITFVPGNLTVTAAPLTIVGPDVSRHFGDPSPLLWATVQGLKNNDSPLVVTNVFMAGIPDEQADVGVYPVTVSGGHVTTLNYYVAGRVDGSITVIPRPMHVTVANAGKFPFEPGPNLSYTVSGVAPFHSLDQITANLSLVRPTDAQLNQPGSYPIGLDVNTAAPILQNYAVTHTPGTYTVYPERSTLEVVQAALARKDPTPPPASAECAPGLICVRSTPLHPPQSYAVAGVPRAAQDVVGLAVAEYILATRGGPLTQRDVQELWDRVELGDPETIGLIQPFLFAQLDDVLKKPESALTAAERAFVDHMANVIHTQRVKAAEDALAGYLAWKEAEEAARAERLAANPTLWTLGDLPLGLPPDDYIEMAKGGVSTSSLQDEQIGRLIATIAASAAAGTATLAAAPALGGVAAVIFPFATKVAFSIVGPTGAVISSTAAGAVVTGGAFVAIAGAAVAVVAAVVMGGFLLDHAVGAENYEAHLREILEEARQPVTFSEMSGMMQTEEGMHQMLMYQLISAAG